MACYVIKNDGSHQSFERMAAIVYSMCSLVNLISLLVTNKLDILTTVSSALTVFMCFVIA
jgi:hypothetical protein